MNFIFAKINMLNVLKGIIEGYSDHKNIDAGLIQEAVQNSKDAAKDGVPEITFKLEPFLTVRVVKI